MQYTTLKFHIQKILKKYSLIGISAAEQSKNIQTTVSGFADNEQKTPLSSDSQFLIYSITKTYIAVLVMLECEQEKLSLDSTLKEWAPEIPNADQITIRQLLNHTSGLPDYGSLTKYHDSVKQNPLHPWSEKEFIENTLIQEMLFEPGKGWGYSNIGYMLLVQILESIENKSFDEIATKLIFEPLQLTRTFIPTTPQDLHALTPGYSTYLSGDPTKLVDVRLNYHPDWVSHKVIASTPSDTSKFLYSLFQGKLVSPDSLKQMTTPIRVPHQHSRFKQPSYGLGLMIDNKGTYGTLLGHGGEGPGYSASAFYSADKQPTAISVFCNTENSDAVEQTVCNILED